MRSEYTAVYLGGSGFYEEKKSRFFADVFEVRSPEDVEEILKKVRKQYYDARHHCYAFRIGRDPGIVKCSDDGEPSGTAGQPILSVLTGAGVTDALIVVTRYFGGTLLGTGGLVRSYTKAAQDAMDHSVLAHKVPAELLEIRTDYGGSGKIRFLAGKEDLKIQSVDYTDKVTIRLPVPSDRVPGFLKKAADATNGGAKIEKIREVMMAEVGKEVVIFEE